MRDRHLSHNSVRPEWVTNEASEARKRGILVPALLDEVEPPSSFAICSRPACSPGGARRMTPTCRSSSVQCAGWSNVAPRRCCLRSDDRRRWELQRAGGKRQPAGRVGAAALLLAAALLVLVLRTAGFIGGATPAPHELAVQSNSSGEPVPAAASGGASRPTNPPGGTINLLDVRDGAKIVAANEAGWKDYIYARDAPYCSVISTNGFVTFAFREERRARFNKLGVFVEATSSYNVKTVELYASDESERGPFQKVGTFMVPNFRNERQPFHEFVFATVTAATRSSSLLTGRSAPVGTSS